MFNVFLFFSLFSDKWINEIANVTKGSKRILKNSNSIDGQFKSNMVTRWNGAFDKLWIDKGFHETIPELNRRKHQSKDKTENAW